MSSKEYGILLREEREKRGLSFEDVSNDTRITINILKSLEAMEKDVFPSETYLHGMLKLYARYLSIGEDKIIEMLKVNTIQEKPVEFELINLQSEKKKKQKKTLLIVSLILAVGLLVFAYVQFKPAISTKIETNKEKKLADNVEETKIPTIEGFYESNFLLGEKNYVTNNDVRALIEISSINPPIIIVNDEEFSLSINSPISLDFDGDNSPDYLLLLRSVDIAKKQILLRLDPKVLQSNINNIGSSTIEEQKEIVSDGPILELATAFIKKPIDIELVFNNFSYFKITSNAQVIREGTVEKEEEIKITSEESFTLYIANDEFVDININKKLLEYEKNGLPKVFYFTWQPDGDQHKLVAIPLP